jgi:predicted transcriptional regulator
VLLALVRQPDARLRDVANEVGVTERAAQRIVHDLVEEGYLGTPPRRTAATSTRSTPDAHSATQWSSRT